MIVTIHGMLISESLRRSDKTVHSRLFWKPRVLSQRKDVLGTNGAIYIMKIPLDLDCKHGGKGGKEAGFGAKSSV